jgi:hypothetical protein
MYTFAKQDLRVTQLNSNRTIAVIISSITAIVVAYFGFLGVKTSVKTGESKVVPPEPTSRPTSLEIKAPFLVSDYFVPSGWMGDSEQGTKLVQLDTAYRKHPRPGDDDGICIRIDYKPGIKRFAGIYWQFPDGNWGDQPGYKVRKAQGVTFWAAGEVGGELVEFVAGGIRGKTYQDSFRIALKQRLEQDWHHYAITLNGQDLSQVIGAFAWSAAADSNPIGLTFYIDDLRYE